MVDGTQGRSSKQLNTACSPGKAHHVWHYFTSDPREVQRADIHTRILVQRYPVNSSHTSRQKHSPCPCCGEADETLQHFLVTCSALASTRQPYLAKIETLLAGRGIPITPDILLQTIMDPSNTVHDQESILSLTRNSRNLTYALHLRRSARAKAADPDKTTPRPTARRKGPQRNILTYREPTGASR